MAKPTLKQIIKALEIVNSRNPNAELESNEVAIKAKGLALSHEEIIGLQKLGWRYSALDDVWLIETWR